MNFILDAQSSYKCPPKDGQYEHPVQCDKYYECNDGVAREKICPDGLVFDQGIRKINKCDQPFNVDCGDRLELRKCIHLVIQTNCVILNILCFCGTIINNTYIYT